MNMSLILVALVVLSLSTLLLAFVPLSQTALAHYHGGFGLSQNQIEVIKRPSSNSMKGSHGHSSISTRLFSCRRNNKDEKKKRNKMYARRFQSTSEVSRRKLVVEQKRNVVAASENTFQNEVFGLTTDKDMPTFDGFDFLA